MDDKQAALLLNIPLAGVNAIGTFISLLFIDKLGRRYLMLRTLPFAAASWIVVAIGMWLNGKSDSSDSGLNAGSIMAFTGVILFLLSFSIGMSSTPWTVNSEIYPLHIIGSGGSVATTTNWLSNFVVATIFPLTLTTTAGEVASFSVLAIFAVLAWVFIYFLLPETANKSIQ